MAIKCKIKKNDMVYVRSGGDKTGTGRVLAVYPQKGTVLVEGINMVSKHKKARTANDERGIVHQEAALRMSKVMAIDSVTNKPTRVKIRINEEGKRERVSAEGNPIKVAR